MEKCHDHDNVIKAPTTSFIITFGSGDHMGPKKWSPDHCYTIVRAVSKHDAKIMMNAKRGLKWATIYDSEEDAGVEKWGLCLVEFDHILPQEGPNL
jgi:hypothetical protein